MEDPDLVNPNTCANCKARGTRVNPVRMHSGVFGCDACHKLSKAITKVWLSLPHLTDPEEYLVACALAALGYMRPIERVRRFGVHFGMAVERLQ